MHFAGETDELVNEESKSGRKNDFQSGNLRPGLSFDAGPGKMVYQSVGDKQIKIMIGQCRDDENENLTSSDEGGTDQAMNDRNQRMAAAASTSSLHNLRHQTK